jgi:Phage protein Gp19/Gp15/Gp42
MAYATEEDLEPRFPRALTAAEANQVEILLDDASFLLSIRVPGLDAAIEGGDEDITHAAMLTTVTMVRRSLLAQAAQQTVNPAIEQIGQTFGPYGQNIKYRSDSGNLWLYGSELEYLLGLLRGDVSEAVSMRSPGL